MANVKNEMPFEERRRKLLAEGALLRIGIMDARTTVRDNLNAESLAKSAAKRMFGSVSSKLGGMFGGKSGGGMQMPSLQSLQSYSPYLLSAISLLSKRSLRKPLFYGGVISVGAAMAYYLTRKRPDAADTDAEAAETEADTM